MKWTQTKLANTTLTHVEQDENSNQCVAASLAMICKNVGYSGHRFGEGPLYSQGAKAMKATNTDVANSTLSDKAFVTQHGIRHNAVTLYLQNYGFKNVRAIQAANTIALTLNGLSDNDSAILACGVDAFHALAAFKLKTVTYVLNPAPLGRGSTDRGAAYWNTNPVQVTNNSAVFNQPDGGEEYWRSVDACYLIPSQAYLGTVKRWLVG